MRSKKFKVTMLSQDDNAKVFCLAGLAVDIAIHMSQKENPVEHYREVAKRIKRISEILLLDRAFLERFNDVQREIIEECS